jgi:hypothetical protein
MKQLTTKRSLLCSVIAILLWGCGITSPHAAAKTPIASLLHIEITQGIQDDHQSVPLLSGRRTIIRAFFNTDENSSFYVTGTLQLNDKITAAVISVSSLKSSRSQIDPKLNNNLDTQRDSLEASLLFEIPDGWTNKPHITIQNLRLIADQANTPVQCDNCAKLSSSVDIFPSRPLKLELVGLRYTYNGTVYQPRSLDFDYAKSLLRREYPTGFFDIETRIIDWSPTPFFAGDNATFDCNTANAILAQVRKLDIDGGQDPLTHYYGMVFDGGGAISDAGPWMRGCASIIPTSPDPSAVGSGPTGTRQPARWNRQPTYGDWYAVHEIGHTFGRVHVGTTCTDQPKDTNYPYRGTDGLIADQAHHFIGLDVGDDSLVVPVPMRVLPGTKWHDIMTYCNDEWPSDYTYLWICKELNGESKGTCGPPEAAVAALDSSNDAELAPGKDNASPLVKVAAGGSGHGLSLPITTGESAGGAGESAGPGPGPNDAGRTIVTLTAKINYTKNSGNIVSLDPVSGGDEPLAELSKNRPSPSDTVVILLSSDGKVLSSYLATSYFDTDVPPGSDETGLASATFPYTAAVSEIEIARNGVTIASQGVSQGLGLSLSPPVATVPSFEEAPLAASNEFNAMKASGIGHVEKLAGQIKYSWEATGPLAANSTYNVQLSIDGMHWRTVAVNLRATSINLDPTWFSGASSISIRVIGKSGLQSALVKSDILQLDQRFSAPIK